MEPKIDELRPPTAGRLLQLWQEQRKWGGDPLERTLLCNARVLAESCYYQNQPVFVNEVAVLSQMTTRQMESLLRRLTEEDGGSGGAETANAAFDQARYAALRGE